MLHVYIYVHADHVIIHGRQIEEHHSKAYFHTCLAIDVCVLIMSMHLVFVNQFRCSMLAPGDCSGDVTHLIHSADIRNMYIQQ